MTVDRRETHAFSARGVYRETGFELSGVGDPVKIHASHAGTGVFTALGVCRWWGRTSYRDLAAKLSGIMNSDVHTPVCHESQDDQASALQAAASLASQRPSVSLCSGR